MTAVCYGSCAIALLAALLVVTQRHAMHALLNLIVMLLALGLAFFALGAPFVAVLQVVIYAGAIMILFVFVVMMLNVPTAVRQEGLWQAGRAWLVPGVLALALLGLGLYALPGLRTEAAGVVSPKQVGLSLYREYLLGVELVSLILTAGLAAAFHLAPSPRRREEVGDA
jgi:NADH-quinone oxidoreductase subunit J